jgi:thiol-disulfide isomerase/thioredoxin
MKRFIMAAALTAALLTLSIVSAFASPTKDDQALVDRYAAATYAADEKYFDRTSGDWKGYRFPDGMYLWVHPSGSMQANLPTSVFISIDVEDGKEYSRTITVPSGRQCYISADGSREWGVVKEQAPDFTLPVLGQQGKTVRLSGLKGKVVLLDFWASWCDPCMRSLPETEALYQKWKGRGLAVYGINIERDEGNAAEAVKSLGLTFPVLIAMADDQGRHDFEARQMKDYQVHAVPALFLIDKKGVVQRWGSVDEKELERLLR